MIEIVWEIPFYILFLILLYYWFTYNYRIIYENMRNENEKSFAGGADINAGNYHTNVFQENEKSDKSIS